MAANELDEFDNFFEEEEQEIFGDNASKVKLFSVTLDDVVTDFAVSNYVNQILIIITQFQKIGSLITVTRGSFANLNGSENIYNIKTISGLDSQDIHLAARFLADHINVKKPIVFGISLKDYEPRTLKAIAKVLTENLQI